jgi:hypothetical protein
VRQKKKRRELVRREKQSPARLSFLIVLGSRFHEQSLAPGDVDGFFEILPRSQISHGVGCNFSQLELVGGWKAWPVNRTGSISGKPVFPRMREGEYGIITRVFKGIQRSDWDAILSVGDGFWSPEKADARNG